MARVAKPRGLVQSTVARAQMLAAVAHQLITRRLPAQACLQTHLHPWACCQSNSGAPPARSGLAGVHALWPARMSRWPTGYPRTSPARGGSSVPVDTIRRLTALVGILNGQANKPARSLSFGSPPLPTGSRSASSNSIASRPWVGPADGHGRRDLFGVVGPHLDPRRRRRGRPIERGYVLCT